MITGLTQKEADERLKRNGYNELPSEKEQTIFALFLKVLQEPMLFLLLAAGAIYLLLGELRDALLLLSFVFIVIGITLYQERKTERALEALKKLSSPETFVVRDGQQKRIRSREVVKDDIIILQEGDRIPADGVVLSSMNLTIDESLLTGEALAVCKTEWDDKKPIAKSGGNNKPFVYSGTLVISGHGMALVTATGIMSEMGKIGTALQNVTTEDTLLKKETTRLVRIFAFVGVILCLAIICIYGITSGDWFKGLLAGLTLSMAMLPEEFSVVLIIFLALGAWRISKRHVLTRNTAVIETLGAITVLCVDKTGTLTMNKMQLAGLYAGGEMYLLDNHENGIIPESYHALMEYAVLASQKNPFDPMEQEIKQKGEILIDQAAHFHNEWKLCKEYPLSKNMIALSHV
ncbi:MAG: HAD-IC family P-type ATPase [bacterium]